ncbi:MAG: hypothetical protein WA705_05540 [Candidatus Ozemobacteraceae bacterium]
MNTSRLSPRWVAWLLVALIAFQPLILNIVQAETSAPLSEAEAEQQKFQKTYDDIMKLKPIKLDWMTRQTLKLADLTKHQDTGTYQKKIEEANNAIKDAKEQAKQAKTSLDLEIIKAKTLAKESDGVKSDLVGTVKAKAQLQDGLRSAGQQIQSVGNLLVNISLVLFAAWAVLSVVGAFVSLGILSALVTPLNVASIVLGIVGGGLKAAGTSLIASSKAGADTDNAALKAVITGGAVAVVSVVAIKAGPAITKAVSSSVSTAVSGAVTRAAVSRGTLPALGASDIAISLNVPEVLMNALSHSQAYDKVAGKVTTEVTRGAVDKAVSEAGKGAIGKGLGLLSIPSSPGGVVVNEVNKTVTDVLKPSPGISVPSSDESDKEH